MSLCFVWIGMTLNMIFSFCKKWTTLSCFKNVTFYFLPTFYDYVYLWDTNLQIQNYLNFHRFSVLNTFKCHINLSFLRCIFSFYNCIKHQGIQNIMLKYVKYFWQMKVTFSNEMEALLVKVVLTFKFNKSFSSFWFHVRNTLFSSILL